VYAVDTKRHVRIPMSDGVSLDADLYLPAGAPPCGAAIHYVPYRKDDLFVPWEWRHRELARRGVAAVVLDVRGTGSSEGTLADEYPAQEQDDAIEAIKWLAGQPWCNGNVGMWGLSYMGCNPLQVAARNPPELKAIIPIHFTDDRYLEDTHYGGGALHCADLGYYGLRMLAMNGLPPAGDAPLGGRWSQEWMLRRHVRPWVLSWIENQTDGEYWRQGSVAGDVVNITCATYVMGGWHDVYRNAPIRTYEALTSPKRLMIGPWAHTLPDGGATGPYVDFVGEMARWFRQWLNEEETGIMDGPRVRLYMQVAPPPSPLPDVIPGYWTELDEWPRSSSHRRLYLQGSSSALGDRPPAGVSEVRVPFNPCAGVFGGYTVPSGPPRIQALDQRLEEPYALAFTSPALLDPLAIVGRPTAVMRVIVSSPIAQLSLRLCSVAPDGPSSLVTRASLNLTRRESLTDPRPVPAGEPIDVALELDAVAWTFRAGDRLRLLVASADWPNMWPAPEDPVLRLVLDERAPCTLELPGVTESLRAVEVPGPQDAAVAKVVPLVDADWSYSYEAIADRHTASDRQNLDYYDPSRKVKVEQRQAAAFSVNGATPADASSMGRVSYAISRGGTTTRGQGYLRVTSTRTTFRVFARRAYVVDGEEVEAVTWEQDTDRVLM
jgi:putative CocE/NonD family hydrolase